MNDLGLGVAAATAAAVGFGAADYLGGMAARQSAAVPVAAKVQGIGLILLLAVAVLSGTPLTAAALLLGAAAGLGSGLGLAILYRALMRGGMGVTVSLGSLVVSLVTLLADAVLRTDIPSPVQFAGVACAIAATWLASTRRDQAGDRSAVGLALAAGVLFGGALVFLDRAAETSPLWSLAAARGVGTSVLLALLGLRIGSLRVAWHPTLGAGILDAGASAVFVGSFILLPVGLAAAVSAAATPLVPMALAWFLLKERVSLSGALTIALACLGITLIALG